MTLKLTYVSFGVVWDLDLFSQLTPQQEEAAFLSAEFLSKKLIEELRKTVAQKDAFMGSISHELRTPLNGIIGRFWDPEGAGAVGA
eukprot:gene9383-9547_t